MSLQDILSVVPPGSQEETLARQVNFDRLPQHVAVIMDGNGRWAAQRHLPRVEGHRADYVNSPAYLYADGRGRFTRFPEAALPGTVLAFRG